MPKTQLHHSGFNFANEQFLRSISNCLVHDILLRPKIRCCGLACCSRSKMSCESVSSQKKFYMSEMNRAIIAVTLLKNIHYTLLPLLPVS